jgi:hypothetical protein
VRRRLGRIRMPERAPERMPERRWQRDPLLRFAGTSAVAIGHGPQCGRRSPCACCTHGLCPDQSPVQCRLDAKRVAVGTAAVCLGPWRVRWCDVSPSSWVGKVVNCSVLSVNLKVLLASRAIRPARRAETQSATTAARAKARAAELVTRGDPLMQSGDRVQRGRYETDQPRLNKAVLLARPQAGYR